MATISEAINRDEAFDLALPDVAAARRNICRATIIRSDANTDLNTDALYRDVVVTKNVIRTTAIALADPTLNAILESTADFWNWEWAADRATTRVQKRLEPMVRGAITSGGIPMPWK